MIREIEAKTVLSRVGGIDTFFGLDYGMNLYRGCQHRCVYCDSRSECYGIEHFDDEVLVKTNAIGLLRDELSRKRRKGIVGTGSMHDPYMPLEAEIGLTRRALELLAGMGFGVHVITKSDLVLRDIDILQRIGLRSVSAVSLTITTIDDDLARRIEPGAPPSSARFHALEKLSEAGIETRVALMPNLPFIEDSWENVESIVDRAWGCGVRTIIASFGMSLRDRQREHYYRRIEELFPGLQEKYRRTYGGRYVCPSPQADSLRRSFEALCRDRGIRTSVKPLLAPTAEEPRLFG
jgi:DNA repair photolyase